MSQDPGSASPTAPPVATSSPPSAAPPTPGSPGSPGATGSPSGPATEKKANPERIRRLGRDLTERVGPHFAKAAGYIQEARGVSHGLFTQTAYPFAAAYVGVVEYMDQDLRTKTRDLTEVPDKLHRTALAWATAEEMSTLKAPGEAV